MPNRRILPSDKKLIELATPVEQGGRGFTQPQIVDWIEKETGERVTRSAVAVALHRAGFSKRETYKDEIPWTVAEEHQRSYDASMLRVRARIKRGLPITPKQEGSYKSWLRRLTEQNAVVAYNRDEGGFLWVERIPGRDADEDIVRRPNRRLAKA